MTVDAPSDAWIVTYEVDGEVHRDLTRGSRVKLFDMYYDKFKMGKRLLTMVRVQSNQTCGVISTTRTQKEKAKVVTKIVEKKSRQNFDL